MKRQSEPEICYLVTKHYSNGMMHHVGSPTSDTDKVEQFIKSTNHRKNYKGRVWISTWKLAETKDVADDAK